MTTPTREEVAKIIMQAEYDDCIENGAAWSGHWSRKAADKILALFPSDTQEEIKRLEGAAQRNLSDAARQANGWNACSEAFQAAEAERDAALRENERLRKVLDSSRDLSQASSALGRGEP